MKKRTIIVVLLIFFGSYTVLGAMNYLPLPGNLNPIYMYPDAQQDPTLDEIIEPIFFEYFQGAVTPDMVIDAKKNIDWDIYGTDETEAKPVTSWFHTTKLEEGWTYYKSGAVIEEDFTAYWQGWTKGFMAHAIIVIDGPRVQNETQYNVVIGSFVAPSVAFLKYEYLFP